MAHPLLFILRALWWKKLNKRENIKLWAAKEHNFEIKVYEEI